MRIATFQVTGSVINAHTRLGIAALKRDIRPARYRKELAKEQLALFVETIN
jgi:hypothetical protein